MNGPAGTIRNNHAAVGNDQTFPFVPTPASSTFVHMALVYQNAGPREERLYVNGVFHSLDSVTDPALALVNSNLILGGLAGGFERINAQMDDVGIWNERILPNRISAIHGLGHFSTVPLNDSDIDAVLAMTMVGQSVTNVGPSNHTWYYHDDLVGVTGTIGGSVGGGDSFILRWTARPELEFPWLPRKSSPSLRRWSWPRWAWRGGDWSLGGGGDRSWIDDCGLRIEETTQP